MTDDVAALKERIVQLEEEVATLRGENATLTAHARQSCEAAAALLHHLLDSLPQGTKVS